MKQIFYLIIFSFAFTLGKAQFVTGSAPVQDGNISASEYYNSNNTPWYMCWDNTYLYIALTGGASNEPGIVYFDFNANSANNGGVSTGSNGSTTGKSDYGTTPNLPFVSNARIFFVTNLNGSSGLYAEINTNTGSGWGSPTVITSSLGSSSGTNRELKVSWAQLQGGTGSKPNSFNWLGTASSTGGYIYNQFPSSNYSGNSTTTPTYYFYQTIVNTTSSSTTNPFSSNFISLSNYNTSFDYTSTLPTSLYDITIGKSGSSGSLHIKSSIAVNGNIAVKNGILDVAGGIGKTITMSGTNQLVKIFNSTGGSITGTDNGVGNDLTLNVNNGNTTIDGDATTNSDHEKKFFNVSVATGAKLILNKGLLVRYGSFNISGTLQINSNGYVQSGVSSNKAASYSGTASTLIYANGGDYATTDFEWPTTNAPNNITIQTVGTNVILNNSKTINGILALNDGKITTGNSILSIGNNGIVNRTSGWVLGNLERGFSVGSNINLSYDLGTTSYWIPVNIQLGSVTVSGSITLRTDSVQHPNYSTIGLNATKYLKRYWTISVNAASFTNAQIQFNYLGSDLQNGANQFNLKAARYSGTVWVYPSSTSVSAYSFSAGGFSNTTMSQSFTAGECAGNIILPTPNTNAPICPNTTLTLNGTVVTSGGIGAISYTWSGVNGFAASTVSTSINNISNAAAGLYTLTATDAIGCSTNKSINISLLNSSSSTTNAVICNGNSYSFNGNNYSTAGSYTAHLINAVGCDSSATLVLTTVNTVPSITGNTQVCVGSTTQLSNSLNGGNWSSSNVGRVDVNNAGLVSAKSAGTVFVEYSVAGCGSSSTLVNINPKPMLPTISYATGTVNPQIGSGGGANFCANKVFTVVGSPIGGNWSSTGVISVNNAGVINTGTTNGAGSLTYTYTTSAGCTNSRTISGFVVTCASRGVADIQNFNNINLKLFPNPARSIVNIEIEDFFTNASISITNLLGKEIKNQKLSLGINTIDISSLVRGFYLINIYTNEGKQVQKLIVE